jgi:transitional endoplasmic reticulum ATPase
MQLLTRPRDPSGAEPKNVRTAQHDAEATHTNPPQDDEIATAILKKKKKPNSLM